MDHAWLERLCRKTDDILWDSYSFSCAPDAEDTGCSLLFPLRDADRRVSEQEARFAFVLALAHEPPGRILFAPENPTRGGYRFAHKGEGTKAQRARTDVSL